MTKSKIINLRPLKSTDQKYFLRWWKDKELISLTSGYYVKSDAALRKYFRTMIDSLHDHHYMIIKGSRTIGHIALTHKDKRNFEIHIIIGEKNYWNRGLGTLALKKALSKAFKELNYKKAYLEVRPDNLRAIRAYEKCGFIKRKIKNYPTNKYQPVALVMTLTK